VFTKHLSADTNSPIRKSYMSVMHQCAKKGSSSWKTLQQQCFVD